MCYTATEAKRANFLVPYIADSMGYNATKMATKKRLLNRIKSVLADQGKTNIWLAEELGRNKTTVSKWCTNDQQPTLETLFDIAEALNVDVKDLLVSNKVQSIR